MRKISLLAVLILLLALGVGAGGARPLDDVFPSGHTRAEYLEDLDYLYELLLPNFPMFGPLYRARDVDLHVLFSNARASMETAAVPGYNVPPGFLARLLQREILNHVGGFGHLAFSDADFVRFMLQVFTTFTMDDGSNPFMVYVEMLDNPATREFYRLHDRDFQPGRTDEQGQHYFPHQAGNVETRILEEGRIGCVRIRQMLMTNMDGDYEILRAFYESIAGYEHLIVDIRGNPGGSSVFFPRLVMSPNIREPLHYYQYMFFMAGENNMRFIQPRADAGMLYFYPVHEGLFEGLPYMHLDDIGLFDYYVRIEGEIEPLYDEPLFDGKVWLLIDRHNFSASESAAAIAKQTGFATLAGETTSGGGIGIDPPIAVLPNTGIVIKYGVIYGTDFQGRNSYEFGTAPHYENRPRMDALQTVLEIINGRN